MATPFPNHSFSSKNTFTLPITPDQLRARGIHVIEEAPGAVVVGNLTLREITDTGNPLFEGVVRIEGDLQLEQVRVLRLGSPESCENLICRDCHFPGGLGDLSVIKKSLHAIRSVLGEAGKLKYVGELVKLTEVGPSDFGQLAWVDSLELRDCDRVVFPALKAVAELTHRLEDETPPTADTSQSSGENRAPRDKGTAGEMTPVAPFPALRLVSSKMTVFHGVYSRPLALPRLIEVNGPVRLCGDIVGKTGPRGVLARVTDRLILEGEGSWDNLACIRGRLTLPLTSIRSRVLRDLPPVDSIMLRSTAPAARRSPGMDWSERRSWLTRSPFPSLRLVSEGVTFVTLPGCDNTGTAFIPESCYGPVSLAGLEVAAVRRMRETEDFAGVVPGKLGPLQSLELKELILNGATVTFPLNLMVVTLSLKARGTRFTSAPLACISTQTIDTHGATLPANTIKNKRRNKPLWLMPPRIAKAGSAKMTRLDTVDWAEESEQTSDPMRRVFAAMSKHRRLVRHYEKNLATGLCPEAAMEGLGAPAPDLVQVDRFSGCLPPRLRKEYKRRITVLVRMLSLSPAKTLGSPTEDGAIWDFLVRHAHDAPIKAFARALSSATREEIGSLYILACESFTLAKILADLLIHTRLTGSPHPAPVTDFIDDALKVPDIRGLTVVALTRGCYTPPKPEDFNHPLILQALRNAEWELIADAPGELAENLADLSRADCRAIKEHWFRVGVPPEALAAAMAQARLKDASLMNTSTWFVPCEEHCDLVEHNLEGIFFRKHQTCFEGKAGDSSILGVPPAYWDLPIMKPILRLLPRLVRTGVEAFEDFPKASLRRGSPGWWITMLNAPLNDEEWETVFLAPDFPRELCSTKPRTMSDEFFKSVQLSLI